MPTAFDPQTSPSEALRASVHRLLLDAIRLLEAGPTVSAVHQARKAGKRARALVDLVGGKRADRVGDRIAAAARHISPIRDADVLAGIVSRHGWSVALPVVQERDGLARATVEELRVADLEAQALKYGKVDEDHLRGRLVRSWRRARRAMDAATDDPTEETLHTWRKRVKRLMYQAQALSNRWPALAGITSELDALQELLGTHHDLLVLRTLAPDPSPELGDEVTGLEQRALAHGRLVLALRPSEIEARLDD